MFAFFLKMVLCIFQFTTMIAYIQQFLEHRAGKFSIKGHTNNLGFADHVVSVATIQLVLIGTKVILNNMYLNGHGWILIKCYLCKGRWICLEGALS